MTIRTILVDDEKLATQGLQLRLEAHGDVDVVDTAQNGREAIRKIKTHKPDLVFLDIQMPGFDGFSVIQGLMEVEPPLVVFVTAYSDHAIRAFEAQARSEEHTSELQSLMRSSYAVFCLKKNNTKQIQIQHHRRHRY